MAILERRLFLVRNGLITQWSVDSNDELNCVTCNNRRSMPYDASKAVEGWKLWEEDEQIGSEDRFDGIFLSDDPKAFDELPSFFAEAADAKTTWTLDALSQVVKEVELSDVAVTLVQGTKQYHLEGGAGSTELKLTFKAPLGLKLPKDAPVPKEKSEPVAVPKPEPKPEQKKTVTTVCADSYGDKKALALKVGDTVLATITVIAPLRGCYYAKSDALCDLIKIKMSALPKGVTFEQGVDVSFKVVAVDDLRVTYAIA